MGGSGCVYFIRHNRLLTCLRIAWNGPMGSQGWFHVDVSGQDICCHALEEHALHKNVTQHGVPWKFQNLQGRRERDRALFSFCSC